MFEQGDEVMGGNIVIVLLALVAFCSLKVVAYNLSPLEFEALSPRGIRVKMRDDDYSAFTFIGITRRNSESNRWETSVPSAKNGYWVFVDRNYDLKVGDVVYYTIYVTKQGIRYQSQGSWTVQGYVTEDDVPRCEISETITQCSKSICRNTLIFSEEFHDANNFKWQKEDMFPQEPDYPFNAYSKDKILIRNGHLIIEPTRTFQAVGHWDFGYACTGEPGTRECSQTSSGAQILPPVVSGKVSTRKLFSFKYGRVEVRAKLPVGDWLIPEIHLEPLHNEYGKQRYGSGLMRIACVKGNDAFSRELHGGPIVSNTEPYRSIFLRKTIHPSENWNDDFHVYTLIWEPSGLQLLVDGTAYGNVRFGTWDINEINGTEIDFNTNDIPHAEMWGRGTSSAPLDEMFYLTLGVRVGGIGDFPDSPEKPWKNSSSKALYKFWKNKADWYTTWTAPNMVVDYVRVYAL